MISHDPFAQFDTPAAFAALLREKVGLSTGYASELANAKKTPSLEVAVKIEETLGIPAAAWVARPKVS